MMILGKNLKPGDVFYESDCEADPEELPELSVSDVAWSRFVFASSDGGLYSIGDTAMINKEVSYSVQATVDAIEPDAKYATTKADAIRDRAEQEKEYGEKCLARAARLFVLAKESEAHP